MISCKKCGRQYEETEEKCPYCELINCDYEIIKKKYRKNRLKRIIAYALFFIHIILVLYVVTDVVYINHGEIDYFFIYSSLIGSLIGGFILFIFSTHN